ncbi:hypothetical protein [Mycolicibacterium sp. 120270]|uniref:hypothetical protein n=1 Tax=Mycolicibacterium sp. 120270 TaxID=3090600 RepID=UPI00299D3B88|nr:hypothetical protein [Mycolicibacterium sp. 120270]MDX1883424.1 hypothetical protein [Mycolicibacterium sp. 120270]
MPDDVLNFVFGPSPYSAAWLWLGLALLLVVVSWYVGVIVWTLPADRLRSIPWIRDLHSKLLRRKFVRAIQSIDGRYRAGELSAAEAGHAMSRTLRSFLHHATGTRAQYMHVEAIRSGDLADAAPVLAALNDAQFNTASPVDVGEVGSTAKELIRSWP